MKVLFIDSVHPFLQKKLEENGHECADGTQLNRSEIIALLPDFDGIVIRSRIAIDKEFLQSATRLKFIARSGAGLENIDVEYCKRKGIQCFNSPEGNRDAVGEHLIGMLLMLFNKLHLAHFEVQKGEWRREKNRGLELMGKSVGIIGFGNNGMAFSEKLKGFECNILAFDKYKTNFDSDFVKEVSLEQLQEESDIISFHVPYNEETHYYFDEKFIQGMAKPFYILNASRGKIIETKSLVNALKTGKVQGACLDVLEYESSSFEAFVLENNQDELKYLLHAENVVLSPHVAGWTSESYLKLSSHLWHKIQAWMTVSP